MVISVVAIPGVNEKAIDPAMNSPSIRRSELLVISVTLPSIPAGIIVTNGSRSRLQQLSGEIPAAAASTVCFSF